MSEWQPIETAPRDGRKFDVWTASGERWTNVWWDSDRADWFHWWLDSWGDGMGPELLGVKATHWMPLPAPPEGDA